jgi:hypothetical protein
MNITAAVANRQMALDFLRGLGFHGLRFKAEADNMIKFFYSDYDKHVLEAQLGKPKSADKSIRYNYRKDGVVAVWPNNKTVILKNSKRGLKSPPEIDEPPKPEVKPPVDVDKPEGPQLPKSGTENDDDKIPHVEIGPVLRAQFGRARVHRELQLPYIKELWHYLNQHKFHNALHMPNLRVMKAVKGTSFRLRGYWQAYNRELGMSPRLFNGSVEFFVEVLLHEMCHQAVSEIDKVRDRTEQGHGPHWIAWMRKVGLNPNRYDPTENKVFMTNEERDALEERQAKQRNILDVVKEEGLEHTAPKPMMNATVLWKAEMHDGIIVCKAFGKKNMWAFLPYAQIRTYKHGQLFNFPLVSEDSVYKPRSAMPLGLGDQLVEMTLTVKQHYDTKKQDRENRRLDKLWS